MQHLLFCCVWMIYGFFTLPVFAQVSVKFEQSKLSNGLTAVVVEDHRQPVMSFQTWYKVGSVDERVGATGLSHMFEHLMFKGTQKYGPRQFFELLEAEGAEINAYTTRDYTVFYQDCSVGLLEKVLDLESDRMAHLELNEDALKNEKMVVLEERRLRLESSLEMRMQEALWQLAYRRHPYQWPVTGNPVDIVGLSLEDANGFLKNFFQPANAMLVLVGDVDAKKTLALIKKYYGSIPGRSRPKPSIPAEPPQTEERRYVMHEQSGPERLMQAYHIPSAKEDDSYALDVLVNILFEGGSSRARRKLVDELNWVQLVTGAAYTPMYPGILMIHAIARNGISVTQIEDALWKLILEVQANGVTEAEVMTAQKQLSVQFLDGMRSPHGVGQLLGIVGTVFSDPHLYLEDLTRYARVTSADVKRVASRYLDPNNRSEVVVLPELIKSKVQGR